jgi:nucleoside-diphosphate-sugar epimerase
MFDDVRQLDEALSEPSDKLVDAFAGLQGDILMLGAGGKMGPAFARMARRAFDLAGSPSRVIAVSRFTNSDLLRELKSHRVEAISGDLFDASFVRELPAAANILYLVGMKFGTATDAARTWASNTYVPGLVADRFRDSRVVALSTGNVYGLVPVDHAHGSTEQSPVVPDGEYAASAIGRERIFEYFSRQNGTRTAIIRLNYATELRYGVIVDLAQKVFRGEPISLATGYFNIIWQRDACDQILRTFLHATSPPLLLNITGLERLSVRTVCERLGKLLDRDPKFTGTESTTALLSDAHLARHLIGPPTTPVEQILDWTADWIQRGGEIWNRPTHFEVRDGKF